MYVRTWRHRCCCCCETQTRTLSGPPSTGASIAMDGGVTVKRPLWAGMGRTPPQISQKSQPRTKISTAGTAGTHYRNLNHGQDTRRTHARTGPDKQHAQAHNHTQNPDAPSHVHTHTHSGSATWGHTGHTRDTRDARTHGSQRRTYLTTIPQTLTHPAVPIQKVVAIKSVAVTCLCFRLPPVFLNCSSRYINNHTAAYRMCSGGQ